MSKSNKKSGAVIGTLNGSRLSAATEEMKNPQISINVQITNCLSEPVSVREGEGVRHVLQNKNSNKVGTCLILSITFTHNRESVKINADEDYSETYIHDVVERYKDKALFNTQSESGSFNRNQMIYRVLAVFDESKIKELGDHLVIPEWGIDIYCGALAKKSTKTRELLDKHHPAMIPENGCKSSGLMVSLNDPNHRIDKAFYRIGSEVFEIDIDRTPGYNEEIALAAWNRINDSYIAEREAVYTFSLDDGLSGDNPIGIKIFTSLEEAKASPENELKQIKDAVVKEKQKQKEEKRTTDREEKLKFGHGILKIFNEVVKTTLPIVLSWGSKLFGIFKRSAAIAALI
ncbi:hypothetical protein TOTORO_02700 [Serratia phage vB_SmaS-Totoro]|nr:hypothetical protein TOTORO_02700 [Serratia phage vB_SmaS-Totoro]